MARTPTGYRRPVQVTNIRWMATVCAHTLVLQMSAKRREPTQGNIGGQQEVSAQVICFSDRASTADRQIGSGNDHVLCTLVLGAASVLSLHLVDLGPSTFCKRVREHFSQYNI